MAGIELRGVTRRHPDGSEPVSAVDLDVADGEFVVLVGPSGSGKSTLLRMIVGLEDITEGELLIGGRRANDLAPRERDLAMVFQDYGLYPHLTVRENIAFPLRLAKLAEADVRRRVDEAALLLELGQHLDRRPSQLSGSQRQRVAMGRAIVRQPNAFLFDEPLSNVDVRLRAQMRAEIGRLQQRLGTTTLYVTHDQTDAMTLGHRVVVLRRGVVQQVGTPQELYERPRNLFVAGFLGSPGMNLLPGTVDGATLRLAMVAVPLDPSVLDRLGSVDRVVAGIRPEHFEDAQLVSDDARPHGVTFRSLVDVVEWTGSEKHAYLRDPPGTPREDVLAGLRRELESGIAAGQLVVRMGAESTVQARRTAEVWLDARRLHLFDPQSGENLTRDVLRAGDPT